MDVQAAAAIAVPVVALVQFIKWSGVPSRYGPLLVLALAAVGVGLYRLSVGGPLSAADVWPLFVGWITVAVSAAGVFGFTRALPDAITAGREPPPGAAADRVRKM